MDVATPQDPPATSRLRIEQMDCPTEEALIRKKLEGLPAVRHLEFDLVGRVLTVEHEVDAEPHIGAAIRSLGMTPTPIATERATATERASAGRAGSAPRARGLAVLVLASGLALGSEAVHWIGAAEWASAALALVAIALAGLGTYRKGWIALRNGELNINALMSIAVTGAAIIGAWAEAAMVMVLFTLAERIEAGSLDRARRAIGDLLDLAPQTATVRGADGSWADVDARSVALGTVVRVRPGARIPLDGVVVAGRSTVDQAPITGEGLPVDKAEGDVVFAGTVNQAGGLEFRSSAAADGSTLARIVRAVEQAQGNRAPTQRFVDRFARVYTPLVVLFALGVAVVPPLAWGAGWTSSAYQALVLLVIACPCALVISTPVTVVSGLAAAARAGILIKGGAYLERGRDLRWLALDKTGTLTHGAPERTDAVVLEERAGVDALGVATALAARSDHPVSRAIARVGVGGAPLEVADFVAAAGLGVEGLVGGVRYRLGRRSLAPDATPELAARLDAWERDGKTAVLLTDDGGPIAAFAVADTLRPTSQVAVAELHALGIRTVLLSGDNVHAARAIALEAGVTDARGAQLPEDKAAAVAELKAHGGAVGMVGDGINDAPALAHADVGFAMGAAGSDTAIETADVALMDDDLGKVARFVRLSRATHRILVQNIAFAIVVKAVFFALTLTGYGTMWMAVFADMGTSLLVVANGLRLLRGSG
ncbi:MAG: heavy metal translocating P-type ATPase [Trueperaceae bacterium]